MLHWPENTRSVELLLSSVMVIFGFVFILPGDTMSNPSYAWLLAAIEYFPGNEDNFGSILVLIGLARWCAVIINGLWRPNALIRFVGCLVGSLFWVTLIISFMSAETQYIPAMFAFLIPSIALESYSAARSAQDAFEQDSLGLRGRNRVRINVGHR